MSRFGLALQPVTLEELKQKFPSKKNTITEETVDAVNEVMAHQDFDGRTFLEHLVDYQHCMIDGRVGFGEFLNAMKFCAYLESTSNLVEAYKKARSQDAFVQERMNAPTDSVAYSELSSAASRYRRSKLVRQILTQSDMPLYLMFQGERYKAVAVLAREMQTAAYSRDRISAAKELLAAVKPPENVQIELGIGPNREAKDLHMELNAQLALLAANQQAMLKAGVPLVDVQKTNIKLNNLDEVQEAELG